jgi:polyisoprenoid-binding protein YceI
MNLKPALTPLVWILLIAGLSSFLEYPATEKFQVDTKTSALVWKAKKVTGEHTGTVQLSAGDLTTEGKTIKEGNFDIDLTSLTVTDISNPEANAKLTGHLKSDDFFSVEKYPKASFVLSSATVKSGNDYLVKGKLTIKGITRDIDFPAVIIRDAKKITATAKIIVDRTKYDIRYRSPNFFENLGDKAIDDEFALELNLVALAQQ